MVCQARPQVDRTHRLRPPWSQPLQRGYPIRGFTAFLIALFLAAGWLVWTLALPTGMATPLNAWEHRCVEEDDTSARICTTEIAMHYGDRDFLFYFARGPSGPVPFIVQSDGAGFQRMVVTVDEKDALEADRCELGACFYEAGKSHKLIRLFRKGKTAHVLIEGIKGKVLFNATLTLAGFTAAYRRYR